MAKQTSRARSVSQRVANRGRERGLDRDDAFRAYAMDRLMFRLGRSDQASEFILKGGLLVANLVNAPFRFTRDIDVLRRHGPPEPEDLRKRFERVIAVDADDGIEFERVAARRAERETDGYDGVKVRILGRLGTRELDVQVDVGFGDATVPEPSRFDLAPFPDDDDPARVVAYDVYTVLAEKIETILTRYPVISHRLKDVLDVAIIGQSTDLDLRTLRRAFFATVERRGSSPDAQVLDSMTVEMKGRTWETDWATMRREKAVQASLELRDAVERFAAIVRPILESSD